MRILAVSDLHGSRSAARLAVAKSEAEAVDVIAVCGDITHFGSVEEARGILSILSASSLTVLFVPGNCDPSSLADETSVEGAKCLHGRVVEVGGLQFIGLGGSPPSPFSTPFEISEEELAQILVRAAEKINVKERLIVLSHSPPSAARVDLTSSGLNVGSVSLRSFVLEHHAIGVLCGHVHEACGSERVNDCMVVNVGPADRGSCALIDVDERFIVRLESL